MALKKIHTIYVTPKIGNGEFGDGEYDAEETFNARFNQEVKEFITEDGAQLVSVATIYYDPADYALSVGDLVKRENETYQPVRAIAEYPSASGTKQINVAYLSANVR